MQNNQTINVQNALMEEGVQIQVEELIHLSMDAGKNSKKEAWSMIEILDQVAIKFGSGAKIHARKYILQLCIR